MTTVFEKILVQQIQISNSFLQHIKTPTFQCFQRKIFNLSSQWLIVKSGTSLAPALIEIPEKDSDEC